MPSSYVRLLLDSVGRGSVVVMKAGVVRMLDSVVAALGVSSGREVVVSRGSEEVVEDEAEEELEIEISDDEVVEVVEDVEVEVEE